jgi:transcriptional regulator with XRE-family HTH domain
MSQFAAKEIGGRIALARNERGLTQDQLTELSTFSKRALQGWEAGANIPYRNMQELSLLLGRPVEWFLHGESPDEDDGLPRLELRLAELSDAVSALAQQFQEATEAVLTRLQEIERRLPSPSERAQPKAPGRRASGRPA